MSETLFSGFMNHDYLLTFTIADDERRERLIALCRDPWMGDEVTADTWEVSNDLDPDAMESAVAEVLETGDRAAYYYLTPPMSSGLPGSADSKRIFRVVIS